MPRAWCHKTERQPCSQHSGAWRGVGTGGVGLLEETLQKEPPVMLRVFSPLIR